MELLQNQYEMCQQKSKICAQITVDDDYIVKDTKPDVVKVIHGRGEVALEEIRVNKDAVWIMGKLCFSVLYLSDKETERLESMESEIPFQEKLNMDGVDENDDVDVRVTLEDLNISMINSRKLSIQALLEVLAKSTGATEACLTVDVSEDVEKLTRQEEILIPVEKMMHKEKLHQKYELPSSRQNIGKILFYMPQLSVVESVLQDGKVAFHGKLTIGVIYQTIAGDGLEWYEIDDAFHFELPVENTMEGDLVWADVILEQSKLTPEEDYDGELRQMSFDYTILVRGQIYREEQVEYLKDLYSLHKNYSVERTTCGCYKFLMKNVAKNRVSQQMQLEPVKPKMLSICTSAGSIEVDRVKVENNGLTLEGILRTELIYMTSSDSVPMASTCGQMEFKQFVEIKGMHEGTEYALNLSMESLQMNLLDHSSYEVLATISVGVLAYDHMEIDNISHVEELEEDMDKNQPGIIGYSVKEGETIWDIAKKYRCTIEDLKRTNELANGELSANQKLLVVKFL